MVVPFLQNSTFTGLISTRDYGTSQTWFDAYNLVQNISATTGQYLSTNNIVIKDLQVLNDLQVLKNIQIAEDTTSYGNITNFGENVSFNQGQAPGLYSFTANGGIAQSLFSFAVNTGNAIGFYAAAFNSGTARGNYSVAEGFQTIAFGDNSHVEGLYTQASGNAAHAEGFYTEAHGNYSHAEGEYCLALGESSHAEGSDTIAFGDISHAEGEGTVAFGINSHAAGSRSTAAKNFSYIWSDGNLDTRVENLSTTKEGQYLIDASGGLYIPGSVGIGTDATSNALTVNGTISAITVYANSYLSGGINLLDALSATTGRQDVNTIVVENSANWNLAYTSITSNSATWNAAYNIGTVYSINSSTYIDSGYVANNFLPLSGGTITGPLSVNQDSFFKQNVTILGNLTALGTTSFANTVFNTATSALSVVNVGPGPALYVYQGPGTSDVASFVDGDGVEVLHVGNANPGGLGYVGVNESYPNKELTVRGEISASGVVYASAGNSNTWNTTNTIVQDLSNTVTFLQSNSSYFLTQNNNLFIDSNAPASYFNLNFQTQTLIKVSQQNTLILNNSGGVVPVSGAGNAFSGNIIFSQYDQNLIPVYTALYPSKYYINYNNLGYLYGNITFENYVTSFSAINFPNLKLCSGNIRIINNSLFELDFKQLEYVSSIQIGGYGTPNFYLDNLKELNFPKLKSVPGAINIGGYGLTGPPLLSSINFDSLETVGQILINNPSVGINPNRFLINVKNLSFPSLVESGPISLLYFSNIKTIDFPKLKISRSGVTINQCSSINELNFPELEYVLGGYITANSSGTNSLTSISFPKLKLFTTPASTSIQTDAGLKNLEIGTNTLLVYSGTSFQCNQTLTQQSVDNLLKTFSRLDGTNGTIAYTGVISLAGGNFAPSYTGGVTTTSSGLNFSRTNTIVTALVTNHGHNTNDIVTFTGNIQSALNGTYTVRVSSANQFEYTTPTSSNINGSGTVTMRRTTVSTDGFRYYQNIALRGNTITINLP